MTAAVLASLAAWLLVPPQVGTGRPGPTTRRVAVVVAVAATAAVAWLALDLHDLLLAGIAVAVGVAVWRQVRRRRAAAAADRRAEQVLAACEAMASDLGAGQPPLTCLEHVAGAWPDLAPVAAAARMGADVPGVLRDLARRPGAAALRTVAATWQVASETGSGLADALSLAAESIRTDRRTARLVAAELAAARATARVLAVLPVAVLLLGVGIGGDPLGFLLGSTPGLVVLAVGLALALAGLTWLERIADAVLGR